MERPLISCIVPVYNVEKYLVQCVESIISQSFKDWELLLVDDGSTDCSGTLCDQFAVIDRRIKVFHKPNGGVSSARNLGIENACADWVTFVDSDDYLLSGFFEGLYKPIADGENVDFVQGGCVDVVNNEIVRINQYYDYYIGKDPGLLFQKFRGLTFSKLFRLENVRCSMSDGFRYLQYDEKMTHAEDMAFTLDYLIKVKCYAFVSEIGYCYRIDNMNSATKSKKRVSYANMLHSYRHLYGSTMRYITMRNLSEQQSRLRLQYQGDRFYSVVSSLYINELCKSERLLHLKDDFNQDDYKLLNYSSISVIKRWIFSLLEGEHYLIFDFIMSLVYRLKKYAK